MKKVFSEPIIKIGMFLHENIVLETSSIPTAAQNAEARARSAISQNDRITDVLVYNW